MKALGTNEHCACQGLVLQQAALDFVSHPRRLQGGVLFNLHLADVLNLSLLWEYKPLSRLLPREGKCLVSLVSYRTLAGFCSV